MSEIDFPVSVKPKLAAIEAAINEAHEKMRLGGRMIVEGALEIGQQLVIAKKIIVPRQWLRWCDETLPFAPRTAQARMKMWSNYIATPEANQNRLLQSTNTIRSAVRFLDDHSIVTEDAQRAAHSGQQVTDYDPQSAFTTPETPIADSEEKQENEPPLESQPPDPDPWQPVKREARDVYARVNASLNQLKEAVQLARGYHVFEFVGAIEQEMNSIKQTLAAAKPTQVCETCRPNSPAQAKSCRVCHDVGMVPKCVNERQRT